MASAEERLKILKMIQEGKITAQEGAELLETLDSKPSSRPGRSAPPNPPPESYAPRWFRVVVTDTATGKTRVNVRLPVSLINAGMKMGARFAPQVEGMDPEQLQNFLRSGTIGKVIDVMDDAEGEHVEVYIE